MRATAFAPVTLFSALCACGPDAPAEPVEPVAEAACPITAPTRLVAAPEGFAPVETDDVWYDLHQFGDDILFTFDRIDDPDRLYWRMNRCTAEIEPYAALAPGFHTPYIIDTPGGRVLYGYDGGGHPLVIDRFDVPGDDEPRPVPGLPDDIDVTLGSRGPLAKFFQFWTSRNPDALIFHAAGVGAYTYAIYTHLGDPDVPAVQLSDSLVSSYYFDDTHSLSHEESGEVHLIDGRTGERELVRTGVRYLRHGFDGRTFIWQAIGDDSVEPVYLHDLETGEDVQIAVNDFAAMSWGRDPDHSDIGEWVYVRAEVAVAAAMIGPGDRFVAALRLDTREAVPVPAHLEQRGSVAGSFRLLVANDPVDVEALWDPLTGDVREWYRGPAVRPSIRRLDGDRVEYFVRDPDNFARGALWRVDLGSGETVPLLTDVSRFPYRVAESRYLVTTFPDMDGPPAWDFAPYLTDLALVDIDRGTSTPVASKVSGYHRVPAEGILFIDAFGPEPGLWAYPLPHGASRSDSARSIGSEEPMLRGPRGLGERESADRLAAIRRHLPPGLARE